MTLEKTRLTVEDLWNLPDDGRLYELRRGDLIEMTPPGGLPGFISHRTGYQLGRFLEGRDLGCVLVGDPGVILKRDPDTVRGPDVCFIARDRIPAGGIPTGYLDFVPDLIIEVVSPSDRAADVQEKVEEWLGAGARLVWVLYPSTQSVVAYHGLAEARLYRVEDVIDGEPVLPGFTCRVSSLFG